LLRDVSKASFTEKLRPRTYRPTTRIGSREYPLDSPHLFLSRIHADHTDTYYENHQTLVINHKCIWVFDVGQKRDEGTTTAGKKGKHVTPASPSSVIFIPQAEYSKMSCTGSYKLFLYIKTAHYFGVHKMNRQPYSHSRCLTVDERTSATHANST